MAAMGGHALVDPFVLQEEQLAGAVNAGHHGWPSGGGGGTVPGCFEIRRPSSDDGNDPGGFDNPYYMVGSNLYQCTDAIDMGFRFSDCVIALCISTGSDSPDAWIQDFSDFTNLQEYAKARSEAVHPLYIRGNDGETLADLRNIPVFPQWEYKED